MNLGKETPRRIVNPGAPSAATGNGYRLFYWKVQGNTNPNVIESGDFCIGLVENLPIVAYYNTGALGLFASFDKIQNQGLLRRDEGLGYAYMLWDAIGPYFGIRGQGAVDVSYTSGASGGGKGAIGDSSFAHGRDVVASQDFAFVSGEETQSLAYLAACLGAFLSQNAGICSLLSGLNNRINGGYGNVTGGTGHDFDGMNLSVFGQAADIPPQNLDTFNDADNLLHVIGCGEIADNDGQYTVTSRRNAVEIFQSGAVNYPIIDFAFYKSQTNRRAMVVTRHVVDSYIKPYDVFSFFLTQSGTDDPVLQMTQDDLNVMQYPITLTRHDPGVYTLEVDSGVSVIFKESGTFVFTPSYFEAERSGDRQLTIMSRDYTGTLADDLLRSTILFECRIMK